MLNITKNIDTFIAEPFKPNMDLWNWLAFLTLVGGFAFLWFMVLDTFKKSM